MDSSSNTYGLFPQGAFPWVFLGSVAVHLPKRHFLDATLDISIERKSGVPRFKPGAAG